MAEKISVTPDKRIIVAGADHINNRPGYIKFWDFTTGNLIRSDKWSHYEMRSLLATPDSRSIIISGRDDHTYNDGTYYILIGDIETGEYRTIKQGEEDSFSLNLSLTWDKEYILFGEHIWDWQAGGNPQPKRYSDPLINILGKIVLTEKHTLESTDEGFVIEDFQTGEIAQKFSAIHDNKHHRLSPMKVTPNGQYILSQKGNYDSKNQALAIWNLHTGDFVKTFDNCPGTIKSIDITEDGQHAIVLCYNPYSIIRVLDIQTGELILSINPDI